MIPDLISTAQAADMMQLTEQRVRSLLKTGKIEGQQIGKQWVISLDHLQKYLSNPEHRVNPTDRNRTETGAGKPGFVALSFFSGAMGLDLGLEAAGIDVLLACDLDKSCRKTIVANKPDIGLLGDVWDYSAEQIRAAAGLGASDQIDLIVGGPPCQSFSTAGARKGLRDKRGSALIRYVELIEQLQPEYAVLENVRGLLSAPLVHRPHAERTAEWRVSADEQPGGALLLIVQRLRAAGYAVSFNLYNSANFGSPQVRERVVLICHRGQDELPYLTPTHSDDPKFGLPRWRTFKEAVAGLDAQGQDHLDFPEKRLKYYRMLGPGQYWKNLPVELQKEALGKSFFAGGGKTGFLRRLAWDKPSPTLVTHPAMPATDLAHPVAPRPLSIQEYMRIQEFPDDWVLCGSLLERYRQVGNAVPIGLGRAIGRLILDHRAGRQIKQYPDFPYSRYKDTAHARWLGKHEPLHGKRPAAQPRAENLELFA
ncbi:DNA cytosine methyltransferase [Castellaniella caeni]|uniref:DNA cytosine methyltransferase n=1 Tax=Castellaniella caeni TaxID=266123 RepID=UPI0009FDCB2D|nr:DNA cytosine methyltransferase [Castellaniella caeni]